MEIKVEFIGPLEVYFRTGERRITLQVEEGTTIEGLWEELNIPEKVERVYLLNGAYSPEGKILRQGDVVSIFPMIDGG